MAGQHINVRFHFENGVWAADSPELPSLFAGDADLDEAKRLVRQVVDEELGEDVVIFAWMPAPESLASIVTSGDSTEGFEDSREWSRPELSELFSSERVLTS